MYKYKNDLEEKFNFDIFQEVDKNEIGGLSNTPYANYDEKLLSHGLDYLKIGFYGELKDEELEKIKAYKELAQKPEMKDPVILVYNNHEFRLLPNGGGNYTYILTNDIMTIAFGEMVLDEEKEEPAFPNIMVTLGSTILWKESADRAYNIGRNIVVELTKSIQQEKVSRVDMCADMTGSRLHNQLTNYNIVSDFVSRARDIDMHTQHRVLTGYSVGSRSSKISARIYNKTQEIKVRENKKNWFYDIWGIEEGETPPVWRFEFEIHRNFLGNYHYTNSSGERRSIETYHDLKNVLYDLWDYLVKKWFSVRHNDNKNISRRTVYSFWKVIQEMDHFQEQKNKVGAVRRKISEAKYDELLMSAKGYITSMLSALGAKHTDDNLGDQLKYVVSHLQSIAKKYMIDDLRKKSVQNQAIQPSAA